MEVFLLRCSIVEDAASAPVDTQRYLSAEGRRLVRAIGNTIRLGAGTEGPGGTYDGAFDRVVTSPLPACVQTAELFADRVDYVGVVEVLPALATSVPAQIATTAILARGRSVVVVADEPFLSELGAFLVGRPTFPPLKHAQVSVVKDREPAFFLRPGESVRSLLLLA